MAVLFFIAMIFSLVFLANKKRKFLVGFGFSLVSVMVFWIFLNMVAGHPLSNWHGWDFLYMSVMEIVCVYVACYCVTKLWIRT